MNCFDNIEKLFFASTDCVYGETVPGNKLSEKSPLNPVNIYGRQKAQAETIVIKHGFTVARLPYMLGASKTEKRNFYDIIKEKLSSGEQVEMIDGMRRSVLSYKTVASLLFALSELNSVPAAVNVCGDASYTKYEMGLKLAERFGADQSIVRKISEEEGRKFFRDLRASDSTMDNTLLKNIINLDEIKWECE